MGPWAGPGMFHSCMGMFRPCFGGMFRVTIFVTKKIQKSGSHLFLRGGFLQKASYRLIGVGVLGSEGSLADHAHAF